MSSNLSSWLLRQLVSFFPSHHGYPVLLSTLPLPLLLPPPPPWGLYILFTVLQSQYSHLFFVPLFVCFLPASQTSSLPHQPYHFFRFIFFPSHFVTHIGSSPRCDSLISPNLPPFSSSWFDLHLGLYFPHQLPVPPSLPAPPQLLFLLLFSFCPLCILSMYSWFFVFCFFCSVLVSSPSPVRNTMTGNVQLQLCTSNIALDFHCLKMVSY